MNLKTGLVLEGGGTRGLYTAGVLDAFMEHNIEFDGVIGVSAGAIHGCSFVSITLQPSSVFSSVALTKISHDPHVVWLLLPKPS